jgi:multiple sugar transport system permease protein
MSTLVWSAMLMLAVVVLLPFLWMLASSLMDQIDVYQSPPPVLPARPRWSNYPATLSAMPFGRFFLNSVVLAVGMVVGQVVTSAMAAYALARLRFPGRERVFLVFLATLMVPVIVLLIPRYLIINALGWVDSYAGLLSTELVSVWGIFLLRQFFQTIPRDLEDAARLDGAGEWEVFRRIILPLSKPALATLAVFSFIEAWKSFLWPLVAMRSLTMRTMEVGVAAFHSYYPANWPYQMVAAVAVIVPLLAVFFYAQKYFIRGIQLTGLK